MIDTERIHMYLMNNRLDAWYTKWIACFIDNFNFCHGYTFLLDEKPYNRVYEFFYKFWLFPFKQNDCICCNTVRGLLYGLLLGWAIFG